MIKWYWAVLIAIVVLVIAYMIGKNRNAVTNTVKTVTSNSGDIMPAVEDVVKKLAAEVNSETANARVNVSQKYKLLNQKLSNLGIWVGPDGSTPPNGILKKCCCRSSIFFGTIPVDCYWSIDCGSSSAQTACSTVAGA